MKLRCPTCRKILKNHTAADSEGTPNKPALPEYFPFCSKRCQLLDFGAWMDEDYRIEAADDQLEDDTPDNV